MFSPTHKQRVLSVSVENKVYALQGLEYNINEQWFMQDEATHHTTRVVLEYLFENFDEHVLSRKNSE